MRNLITAAATVAFLAAVSSSAFAATPASAPAMNKDKAAACQKAWKDQKKHTQAHDAFIKACVAKG